jgi:hypothetical protein
MPDDVRTVARDRDPYAWLLAQAALLERSGAAPKGLDLKELKRFLDEAAEDMLAAVRSQLVNLMAHAAKVARTSNPQILCHWRSECVESHDRLIDAYRPSMRQSIDRDELWRRAKRKVVASFADHGEAKPRLPDACPFSLDELVDKDLDVERLAAQLAARSASAEARSALRPQRGLHG